MANHQQRSDAGAGLEQGAQRAALRRDSNAVAHVVEQLVQLHAVVGDPPDAQKVPVVASRSGLLPSLSGVNMILVGGYGCWNVSFGSLLNFPVSSSTARASSSHGYGAAAAVRYGPSQSSGQIAPCDTL